MENKAKSFLKRFQLATLKGVAVGKPIRVSDWLEEFKEIGGKYAEHAIRAERDNNLSNNIRRLRDAKRPKSDVQLATEQYNARRGSGKRRWV